MSPYDVSTQEALLSLKCADRYSLFELIGLIDFALSRFCGLGCIVFKMLGNDVQLIV
jgi:hypothetical protein